VSVLRLGDQQFDHHELGIIRHVGFGMRDFRGRVGLWFDVGCYPSHGSLQCLFGDDIETFLKSGGDDVYDIKDLNGRAVIMLSEGGLQHIVGLFKS